MAERLRTYIEFIEGKLNEALADEERERLREDMLIQIGFFQHERLVHLIVTVTFALLAIMTFLAVLITETPALWALLALLLVLLVPYVLHYYRLENGVQKLYAYYDELVALSFHKI